MEIRPGRDSDLEAIVGTYNHYVEHSPATFDLAPIDPGSRAAWLAEHSRGGPHRLLVAVDDAGRLLGWATTSRFRERAAYATTVESSVYCRPDARGLGVGSRLYATLFASIQGERVERIVAGVTLPNPASLALHRRFGFRPVGVFTRVGSKFDRFWDVQWFERPLRWTDGAEAPVRAPLADATEGVRAASGT
jgi:phosphinothricin acetyltransferase